MKTLFIYLLFTTLLFSNLQASPVVDPKKFSGLWYEIARTYNSYQEDCVASSVEYVLDEENNYDVYNRCFDTVIGGELIEYNGEAESANGEDMNRIDMTYFWIFTRSYNVLYVDSNYTSALVSDDDFEQVWIMSRTPTMKPEVLERILAIISSEVSQERLIYTPQDAKGRYR